MYHAKARMRGGEVVQNAGGGICRAIIYGNDLKVGIIDRGEAGEAAGSFSSSSRAANSREMGGHSASLAQEKSLTHGNRSAPYTTRSP